MSWFRRRKPVDPSVRDECEYERCARAHRRDAEGEALSPGFQWARSCPNSFPVSDVPSAPVGASEQPPRSPSRGLPGSSQPGDDDVVRGGFHFDSREG